MVVRALALFGLLLCAVANAQVRVSDQEIYWGEAFRLQIKSHSGAKIDPRPLEHDFKIVGSSTGQEIVTDSNGTRRTAVRTFTLLPKRSGDLEIPSLIVDGAPSTPIPIKVKELQTGDNMFSLELALEDESLYVNQQGILRLEIWSSQSIRDYRFGTPSHPTLMTEYIQQVNRDDPRTQTAERSERVRDGKTYSVVERRYLITPTKAGEITVDPVMAEILISSKRRGAFDIGTPMLLESKPFTLSVKPIPKGANGWWLPAQSVTLKDIGTPPDTLQVGQPWLRKFSLHAVGASSAQLPEIKVPTLDGAKVYAEVGAATNELKGSRPVVQREHQWSIIPTTAGRLELPQVRLQWWDVGAEQWAEATLPALSLPVLDANGQSVQSAPSDVQAPEQDAQAAEPSESATQDEALIPPESGFSWQKTLVVLLLALALLAVMALIALAYRHSDFATRRRWLAQLRGQPAAQKSLYATLLNLQRSTSLSDESQAWIRDFGGYLYGGQQADYAALLRRAPDRFRAILRQVKRDDRDDPQAALWPEL